MIERLDVILKDNAENIERQEYKIINLKEQLLKSTQNNIHAIF